jgi:hypothetical protein
MNNKLLIANIISSVFPALYIVGRGFTGIDYAVLMLPISMMLINIIIHLEFKKKEESK